AACQPDAPANDRSNAPRRVRLTGGVRPEHVTIVDGADGTLAAPVAHTELLGHETLVHADVDGVRLVVRMGGMMPPAPGARVRLRIDPARIHLFPADEGG